jgi:Fe-S oxidoreductase
MHVLPLLESRRGALEKCTFCPKLCRSACPVSNAETRETITPWGKMSLAYFAAHGDVPLDASHTDPAWACTGCKACKHVCDHQNDVATTLYDARAAMMTQGHSPVGATRVVSTFDKHAERTRHAVAELAVHASVRRDAETSLLTGCSYARATPREARDAIFATAKLVGDSVSLAQNCCGLPLLMAGAQSAFKAQGQKLAVELQGKKRLVVLDPGCAVALKVHYPRFGIELPTDVEVFVELAATQVERLRQLDNLLDERVRYHDPCQLGRGLGVYDAPRAVLTRLLGRSPDEFDYHREMAACSGAGGLLPSTMPDVAKQIARTRVEQHEEGGGGRIVTACASSLLSFRANAAGPVDDIATWVAKGLGA